MTVTSGWSWPTFSSKCWQVKGASLFWNSSKNWKWKLLSEKSCVICNQNTEMLISQETFEQVVEGIKFFSAFGGKSRARRKNWPITIVSQVERDRTRPWPFLGRKRKTILTDGACCKNLVILKKRIKIQEHVIESADVIPGHLFSWWLYDWWALWSLASAANRGPECFIFEEFSLLHSPF